MPKNIIFFSSPIISVTSCSRGGADLAPSSSPTPAAPAQATASRGAGLRFLFRGVVDEEGVEVEAVRQDHVPDVVPANGESFQVDWVLALQGHLHVFEVRV